MLNNLRIKIKEQAKLAVYKAEEVLGSCKGKEKKAMAIEILLSKLNLPSFIKPFVRVLFSSFIDEAIELAVEYMKSEEL